MSVIILAFFYQTGWKNVSAAEVTKSFDYTCIANTSIAGEIDIDMKVTPEKYQLLSWSNRMKKF